MDQQAMHDIQQENARLRERVAELERENIMLTQAVDARRHSEMQLQSILESMTDNILVWDSAYDYLYANQAAIDHVGTTRDQVIGKNIRDGLGHIPDFMRLWMQRIDHVFATNEPLYSEDAEKVGDRMVYSESVLAPMRGPDNQPVAVALVYRDITERKQQEEELRMFQFAVDNISDGIHWLGPDGRNIYVNHALCQNLGYSREELLQMTIDQLAPQMTLQYWHDEWWQLVKQHGTMSLETLHRRKEGSQFPVEITANYISFQEREYLVAFVRDITERKQQETSLQLFKAMADTAPDGFGIADHTGVLTYANEAYRAMTGYGERLVGMRFNDHFSAEHQSEAIEAMTQASLHGEWRGLMHFQRPDGSQIPVEGTGFVIRDAQGNISSMMGLFRDITEKQRIEREREELQQQVIDAQRNTLRELSTPLIPISDDVVIMPLIGTIDSQRAQMVMEALLEGVARHQAELVVLDITGVSVVDTQVAQAFIQAAQAVQLLGAQVMLTGIQPQIAQTLVTLGIDLTSLQTQGSLQAGIALALRRKGTRKA